MTRSCEGFFSFAYRHGLWSPNIILLACGIFAISLVLLVGATWPSLLEPLELSTVDLRFRYRPPIPVSQNPSDERSDQFVAIDYDDRAAHEYGLGRWPWDRRVHAQVFDLLKKAGARAIMIDLLFDHEAPDSMQDQALIKATRQTGKVIYPLVLQPTRERQSHETIPFAAGRHLLHAEVTGMGELPGATHLTLPFPSLAAVVGGLGHIQRTPDTHGGLRRLPLLYAVRGGFIPALSLTAAMRIQDINPASLHIERGHAIRFMPRDGNEVSIPIDREGRVWINYAGPWGTRFVHYPYSWILDQLRSPESRAQILMRFKDRSVLISNLTTGSGDRVATPFESDFPTSEVALHLLNMITSRQFLRDSTWMEALISLIIPVMLLTGSALAGGPTVMIPAFSAIMGLYLLILQGAFNRGLILPAVNTITALAMGFVMLLIARFLIIDRERARFQTVLGACLPPQTIQVIRESPARIPSLLTGHSRELTVFFADIQGFSSFCKRVDALEIQRILRDYLTAMTEIIRHHGGTLDKYMGDGIMAFFGDAEYEGGGDEAEEKRVERQAANAVRAALAMQKKMAELNVGWQNQRKEFHQIRIGINTGIVTVGNLGTEYLWDYTVIGQDVNKAQRLERAADPGGLLLSQRTYALAIRQGVLPAGLPSKVMTLKGIGDEGNLCAVSPELVAQLILT